MNLYDFSVKKNDGGFESLSKYKGNVLLIVNTASKCRFTPQLGTLEKLYQKFKNKGFNVLAFPCNQFENQEPLSNKEILEFCKINFSVSFPVYAKIDVNGRDEDHLFTYLKKILPGIMGLDGIKWNFTKFLIDKNGRGIKRYFAIDSPQSIESEIEQLLQFNENRV